MPRLLPTVCLVLAAAALATAAPTPKTPTAAADWPQFRGPHRDNVSADKGLLKKWPEGGPELVWTGKGVGDGYSSVAVACDKVFTMGDKDGASWVFALRRDTGEPAWSAKVGKPGGPRPWEGARGTPTVDGDRVYALGQMGELVCLQTADGKEVWRKDFGKDFGGRSGYWKYAESPLIDGDRLVCTPGGKVASMVVLNKKTGEEIWRAPLKVTAGYASIVISHGGGVKQYVQLTGDGTLGVSAKDGKLLWQYKKFAGNTANAPSAVVLGDQIFTCAGYGKGGALLTLKSDGPNGVTFTEEYYNTALKNKHGGVLVVGPHVYGDTDDSGNVHCADWKTGKVKWTRRQAKNKGKGSGSAALTTADGCLYVHYQNGWMSLVPLDAGGYTETGSFRVPESDKGKQQYWAYPVVTGGRLYVRQKENVFCYDIKAK
jgi:outer membrane protein assembly factor BamB